MELAYSVEYSVLESTKTACPWRNIVHYFVWRQL